MPKFYTRYGKRIAVQLEFKFPSLTEQHHKDDCDLNVVLTRYMKTGELPLNTRTGVYADISDSPADYADACRIIEHARDRFAQLPSSIRDRFNNDPLQLLQFLDDPANRAEAEKLGLVATVPGDVPDARAGASPACVTGTAATPGATAEASSEAKD